MASLTIAIEDSVLLRARARAAVQGASVDTLLRDFLVAYANDENQMVVRREIVERGRALNASSGSDGHMWLRDDLYGRGC